MRCAKPIGMEFFYEHNPMLGGPTHWTCEVSRLDIVLEAYDRLYFADLLPKPEIDFRALVCKA